MNDKKRMEAFQFERFCHLHFGKQISFNQPDPPNPDISFTKDNKKYGCELTTLYPDMSDSGGSLKKKNEELFKRLCRCIESELVINYPVGYIVTLRFNFEKDLRINGIKAIAQQIAQEIGKYISKIEQSKILTEGFKGIINHPNISDQIQISITGFPEIGTYINPSYGAFVPKIGVTWLNDAVIKKQNRIMDYDISYDYLWLLLISQEGLSSDFEVLNKEDFDPSKYNWDKIFLFQMFGDKILELK